MVGVYEALSDQSTQYYEEGIDLHSCLQSYYVIIDM